ncbi:hypothetical protein WMY93_008787 [Mugilogobius chulae]|uniref:BED-type domain-containing protein n=1 Tax=Mugilogobius chulae TaxID=88201 RepID=A0AAW0PIL7_9GOBI
MAGANAKPELEDPPSTLRSPVWEHFGFPIKITDGQRQADKSKAVCRLCSAEIGYTSGNTSNLSTHLKRHHPTVSLTSTRKKTTVQTQITSAFKQPLAANSDRAKAITRSIGIYMANGPASYSLVESAGFKYMMKIIEPRYQIPSRPHFSQKVVPALYEQAKSAILNELTSVSAVALTTDGWTSRATESYLTVTVHFISSEWKMMSHVLQTRAIYDQHTSTNLAEALKEAVHEWKLERSDATIPVTTDNARNIINAVKEAGSTTAAHILQSKQEMLNVPKHKLIQDVPTRWNSSYDMLERYLEQQAAVYSALTEKALKKNKDINTLNDQDVVMAEELLDVLKPLKTITTLMSTESTASVSMILPLKTTVLHSMQARPGDSPTVRDIKVAIKENLEDRYSACLQFLHKCTAMDPRFKSLPHLDDEQREQIFNDVIAEVIKTKEQQAATDTETLVETSDDPGPSTSTQPLPPPAKSLQ